MIIAEWYDWNFKGIEMLLAFTCPLCHSEVVATSPYEPVPLHYESLLRASKVRPKCKCGAIYILNEDTDLYELLEIVNPHNPNQLLLFN